MNILTILLITIVALCVVAYVAIQMSQRRRARNELGRLGFDPDEITSITKDLKQGKQDEVLERITVSQERQRKAFKDATGVDPRDVVLTIGDEISWEDVHLQVFKVLEFDRTGTTIGPNNEVQALNIMTPYGYLLAESPILNQAVRLPIIHRDDFLLAASVFDEPDLAHFVDTDELLVTYGPKKLLKGGLSGHPSHVLHYAMTPSGTLEKYYLMDSNIHMVKPNPEIVFGPFVYEGEIKVQVSAEPNL